MSTKTRYFAVMFLFVTLITLYPSKTAVSYGQASFYSDSPLIAETTECISSLMTSTIVGASENCTEMINKVDPVSNTSPNVITPENDTSDVITPENDTSGSISDATSLSKNNPFYTEFQNPNDDTSSFPVSSSDTVVEDGLANTDSSSSPPPDNPPTPTSSDTVVEDGLANTDSSSSPPPDNPPTSTFTQQQNPNLANVTPPSPIESIDSKNNSDQSANEINELRTLVDENNEDGEKISECFHRASVPDAYLADLEIIECAEDHESFSDDNNVNLDVSDEVNSDNNNDKSDNTRIKEISECFHRAFISDAYLADLEIIECAEDHESFSDDNNVNLDVSDEVNLNENGSDDGNSDENGSDDGNSDENDE